MEILAYSDGEYHVKLHIHNKTDNFKWSLIAVYGAAQDEFKADFLGELVNLAKDSPYLILIERDFNLLRFRYEKLSNSNLRITHNQFLLACALHGRGVRVLLVTFLFSFLYQIKQIWR
jgi:hypothetical protein